MDSPKTEEEKLSKGYKGLPANFHFDGGVPTLASKTYNTEEYEVRESRMSALKEIMEALTDPNISMMGECVERKGKDDNHMGYQLERVIRRARKDNLFGMIVMVSIRKKPGLRRIQDEIADELGFSFEGQGQEENSAFCVFPNSNNKAVTENARQLSDRIRTKPKILFVLCDLRTRLYLDKLGIPFGVDHQACKLILHPRMKRYNPTIYEYTTYFQGLKPYLPRLILEIRLSVWDVPKGRSIPILGVYLSVIYMESMSYGLCEL